MQTHVVQTTPEKFRIEIDIEPNALAQVNELLKKYLQHKQEFLVQEKLRNFPIQTSNFPETTIYNYEHFAPNLTFNDSTRNLQEQINSPNGQEEEKNILKNNFSEITIIDAGDHFNQAVHQLLYTDNIADLKKLDGNGVGWVLSSSSSAFNIYTLNANSLLLWHTSDTFRNQKLLHFCLAENNSVLLASSVPQQVNSIKKNKNKKKKPSAAPSEIGFYYLTEENLLNKFQAIPTNLPAQIVQELAGNCIFPQAGQIHLQNLNGNQATSWKAHNSSIRCLKTNNNFLHTQFVSSSENLVAVWDIRSDNSLNSNPLWLKHQFPVTCLDIYSDVHLFTAADDYVYKWDIRNIKQPVATFNLNNEKKGVRALASSDKLKCVSAVAEGSKGIVILDDNLVESNTVQSHQDESPLSKKQKKRFRQRVRQVNSSKVVSVAWNEQGQLLSGLANGGLVTWTP